MRVNRPKPPRSIRYVLPADRKLQRLSLRRISVPAKKTRKARKSTTRSIRPKNPAPMSETAGVRAVPTRVTSITRSPLTPRAVFVGAICVMAAAVLIAARQPFQQTDVASISAPPKAMPLAEEIALPKPPAPPAVIASSAAMASTESAAPAARLETKKTVPPKPVRRGPSVCSRCLDRENGISRICESHGG